MQTSVHRAHIVDGREIIICTDIVITHRKTSYQFQVLDLCLYIGGHVRQVPERIVRYVVKNTTSDTTEICVLREQVDEVCIDDFGFFGIYIQHGCRVHRHTVETRIRAHEPIALYCPQTRSHSVHMDQRSCRDRHVLERGVLRQLKGALDVRQRSVRCRHAYYGCRVYSCIVQRRVPV